MLGKIALPLALVAVLGAVGCSSEADGGGGASVTATLTDSSLTLSPSSASAGPITFQANNDGTTTHELYVFATDLPVDQLPVEDGKVQEADGVEFLSEVEDVAPGTSKDLSTDLEVGNYVLLCNIPGHYEAGVRASFAAS
jgi:uncharacterized cupredoxin-like copper-binding protein